MSHWSSGSFELSTTNRVQFPESATISKLYDSHSVVECSGDEKVVGSNLSDDKT